MATGYFRPLLFHCKYGLPFCPSRSCSSLPKRRGNLSHFAADKILAVDKFLQSSYFESIHCSRDPFKEWMRGTQILGRISRKISRDRALPGPSPSANLVGIWKGKGRKLKPLPSGFFIFPCPQRRKICLCHVFSCPEFQQTDSHYLRCRLFCYSLVSLFQQVLALLWRSPRCLLKSRRTRGKSQ